MRKGVNPEKFKQEKINIKPHRVIIVFFIPDSEEDYFKDLHIVFKRCLQSLFETINTESTSVTLINNNSGEKVHQVIEEYKHLIDKYVIYSENKGKIYAVMNEVRSVYEDFVTIADADVFFLNGWEKSVFEIFKNVSGAGVVSPLPVPHGAFIFNKTIFFEFLKGKIKYKSLLKKEDTELYKLSIESKGVFKRKDKLYWDEKQFYFNSNAEYYLLGATHFVATYKSSIFKGTYDLPVFRFKKGDEANYIDLLADKKGLFRLSTKLTYAYHMGNNVDTIFSEYEFEEKYKINKKLYAEIKSKDCSSFEIFLKRLIGGLVIRYLKI